MAQSRPSISIISLLMQHVSHEYLLCVTFVTSYFVLRHLILDASKNVQISHVLEFEEIRRCSYISRDDSNGEICFFIRDLEKNFVLTEIMILLFSENWNFLGSYILPSLKGISSQNSGQSQQLTCICNVKHTMHVN